MYDDALESLYGPEAALTINVTAPVCVVTWVTVRACAEWAGMSATVGEMVTAPGSEARTVGVRLTNAEAVRFLTVAVTVIAVPEHTWPPPAGAITTWIPGEAAAANAAIMQNPRLVPTRLMRQLIRTSLGNGTDLCRRKADALHAMATRHAYRMPQVLRLQAGDAVGIATHLIRG